MADDGNSVNENQEEFINLLRNSITSYIAELDGSPDRDYSTFRIDCLYHTTLRFTEFFELDDSVIQLISDARDFLSAMLMQRRYKQLHALSSYLLVNQVGQSLKNQKKSFAFYLISGLLLVKQRLFLELVSERSREE